jgi:hypothetical protein
MINERVIRMSKGNPGALRVMMDLAGMGSSFDYLAALDEMSIYGSDIWLCYKDVCGQSIFHLMDEIRNRTIKEKLYQLPDKIWEMENSKEQSND